MLSSLRSLGRKSSSGGLWKCSLSPSYQTALPIFRSGLFSNNNTDGNENVHFMKFMEDPVATRYASDPSKLDDLKKYLTAKGLDERDMLTTAYELSERYSGSKSMFVLPSLDVIIINKNIQCIQCIMKQK